MSIAQRKLTIIWFGTLLKYAESIEGARICTNIT